MIRDLSGVQQGDTLTLCTKAGYRYPVWVLKRYDCREKGGAHEQWHLIRAQAQDGSGECALVAWHDATFDCWRCFLGLPSTHGDIAAAGSDTLDGNVDWMFLWSGPVEWVNSDGLEGEVFWADEKNRDGDEWRTYRWHHVAGSPHHPPFMNQYLLAQELPEVL